METLQILSVVMPSPTELIIILIISLLIFGLLVGRSTQVAPRTSVTWEGLPKVT